MPRGEKSVSSDKQKRQEEHIEEGYEGRGISEEEAERRAWATVNRMSGGGKASGSGRGQPDNHAPAHRGGKHGRDTSSSRSPEERSAAARKGAATRKRHQAESRT